MLPHAVLHSRKYVALSYSGRALLIDVAGQYNGKNNGDLSITWTVMKSKGWKSEATLNKAKQEILAAGFVAETRKGQRPNLCSLYGITWQPLDENPKLDVKRAGFPVGAWAH